MKTIYENSEVCLLLKNKEGDAKSANKAKPITCVMDVLLARQLYEHLTPTPDEDLAYICGFESDGKMVLTGIIPVELDHASPVRARANPESAAKALAHMHEGLGLKLCAIAHSHPGTGPDATHPSKTDYNYHGAIEEAGSKAVGMIFSRDGYVRFFRSSDNDFEVEVHGKIESVEGERHVFKIK